MEDMKNYLKRNKLIPAAISGFALKKLGNIMHNKGEIERINNEITISQENVQKLKDQKAEVEAIMKEIEEKKDLIREYEKMGLKVTLITSGTVALMLTGLGYMFVLMSGVVNPLLGAAFGGLAGLSIGIKATRPKKHLILVNGELKEVKI
jgi:hypothetical protein